MKCHFNGGPWAGKTVELPVAFNPMDVEQTDSPVNGNEDEAPVVRKARVRYCITEWVDGEPHYHVEGLAAAAPSFPMPKDFPGTAS